jgi:hypothetical protein
VSNPAELHRLVLERFPALASLPRERLEALVAQSQVRQMPAGSVLF